MEVKSTGLGDELDVGLRESGMTPGLLTRTKCLVLLFVDAGDKGKEPYLVGKKKIKLSSEHIRMWCQDVYEAFKWRCHISSCIYTWNMEERLGWGYKYGQHWHIGGNWNCGSQ